MTEHNEVFRDDVQERVCYVYIQNKKSILEELTVFVCKIVVFYFVWQLLQGLEVIALFSWLGL